MNNTKGKRMYYKISKFLTIGLLIFSCSYVRSSNINNYDINNNTDGQVDNNQKQTLNKKRNRTNSMDKKDVNKIVNNYKDIFDKVQKEFPNIKKLNRSNVLTLSNNNCKCWFMSTFQLFVTALNQSDPNDPIRKTNFAKFVTYLYNMQNDFERIVNIHQENNNVNLDRKTKLKFKNEKLNEELDKKFGEKFYNKIQGITDYEWEYRNVRRDRTGKSNVIGARIDLVSELILWSLKNGDWYNIVENKNNINDITKTEENRRNEAVELLESLKDINADGQQLNCVMIILNLFPELKEIFGSYSYNDLDNKKEITDVITNTADTFNLNVDKIEEAALENGLVNEIPEMKIPKLSSYTPRGNFLSYANVTTQDIFYHEGDVFNIINNKKYVILPYSISGCRKFIENGSDKVYELIGIGLGNKDHAVCFVKTGKSDSSWSGIDSNRNANDDKYKLEDIIDDSNSESNNNYDRLKIIENNLKNKNNYLAKIYYNENGLERYNIAMSLTLYKKLSSDEIKLYRSNGKLQS